MSTSVKMIKFDLNLKGVKVTNLEQLQDNFCADILPIFQSGRLAKWFKSRDMLEQATAIGAIDKSSNELQQLQAICQVLELDDDEDVLQFLLDDRQVPPVEPVASAVDETVVKAEDTTPSTTSGVDWSGQDMSGRSFVGEDLRNANLKGTNFSGADLSKADLSGANLCNANLTMANLSDALVVGADLCNSCLSNANLRNSDLSRANLVGVNSTVNGYMNRDASSQYKKIAAETSPFNPFGHMVEMLSVLHELKANQEGDGREFTNFQSANLSHAILDTANLIFADFTKSNMSYASMISAELKGANFTQANLSFANFNDADLLEANLYDAKLTGVTGYKRPEANVGSTS